MAAVTGQWRARSADAITFQWRGPNGESIASGSFVGLFYNVGRSRHPPTGFGWLVFTDQAADRDRIVTFTDPHTGRERPVTRSLSDLSTS